MKSKKKNLVVDLNNLVFITRFATIKTPSSAQRKEEFVAELIFKEVVSSIVYFANQFKTDSITITCDSPNVWRKDVMASYKGGRDHDDPYYNETIEAANMCKTFFRECTNVSVFEVPRAEADDVIAVLAQESEGVENIILSSDKDFIQLIDEDTSLYSPAQKTWRESDDPAYDLFIKCIRGDKNDHIMSAFPRVRETKLKEAWEDPYKMVNVLETVRKDGQKVADAYDLNKSLIDLTLQPPEIRSAILTELQKPRNRSFGELKIMSFFAKNNLKEFADMLAYKEKPLKGMFQLKEG